MSSASVFKISQSLLQESPTRSPSTTAFCKCSLSVQVFYRSALKTLFRKPCKGALQECLIGVTQKNLPQQSPKECRARASSEDVCNSFSQESDKSVLQQYLARGSCKSVPRDYPTRVFFKDLQKQRPKRKSRISLAPQCPIRVSYTSVPHVGCPAKGAKSNQCKEFGQESRGRTLSKFSCYCIFRIQSSSFHTCDGRM